MEEAAAGLVQLAAVGGGQGGAARPAGAEGCGANVMRVYGL